MVPGGDCYPAGGLVAPHTGWQGLQVFPLLPPTVDGALVQGGVDPHIRLVCQPVTDASVGSSTIEQRPVPFIRVSNGL